MKGKIRVAESAESCFKRNTPILRTAQRKSSLVIVERSRIFFLLREGKIPLEISRIVFLRNEPSSFSGNDILPAMEKPIVLIGNNVRDERAANCEISLSILGTAASEEVLTRRDGDVTSVN